MNAIQNYVWGLSKKPQQYEETIIEITTTQPNQTFEWDTVIGVVQYYDWDNGIRTKSKSHTFANAGTYEIKIVGFVTSFKVAGHLATNTLVTKVKKVAKTMDVFQSTFKGCVNLTSIPNGLFDKNVNVTDFSSCFSGCTGLTSIPNGLFDKNANVTHFSGCFSDCTGLTSIPNGLFNKNVNVLSFSLCFFKCTNLISIPARLFDNNIKVENFSHCFFKCTNLISIPARLFDNNIKVKNFSHCFSNCTNLTSIPMGLFDNNIKAGDFDYCFGYCSKLTNRPKPHNLEMWQIAGTNGRPTKISVINLFQNCHAMPDYNSLPNSVKQ